MEVERVVLGTTVGTLRLEVSQLEDTLAKEQERADRSHTSLTATRTQLNQAGGLLSTLQLYILTQPIFFNLDFLPKNFCRLPLLIFFPIA